MTWSTRRTCFETGENSVHSRQADPHHVQPCLPHPSPVIPTSSSSLLRNALTPGACSVGVSVRAAKNHPLLGSFNIALNHP